MIVCLKIIYDTKSYPSDFEIYDNLFENIMQTMKNEWKYERLFFLYYSN